MMYIRNSHSAVLVKISIKDKIRVKQTLSNNIKSSLYQTSWLRNPLNAETYFASAVIFHQFTEKMSGGAPALKPTDPTKVDDVTVRVGLNFSRPFQLEFFL